MSVHKKMKGIEDNVYLFVPNIIGYIRGVCVVLSCYYMPTSPVVAMLLYMTNVSLDELDGRAARRFKQTSQFGALLDTITDRCGYACLVMMLGHVYPAYLLLFQMLLIVDVGGHWIYVHSTMLKGQTSHKQCSNVLLQFYYSKPAFDIMWFFSEVFLCVLYLSSFDPGVMISMFGAEIGVWNLMVVITFPIFTVKEFMHVVKAVVGFQDIAAIDVRQRRKQN